MLTMYIVCISYIYMKWKFSQPNSVLLCLLVKPEVVWNILRDLTALLKPSIIRNTQPQLLPHGRAVTFCFPTVGTVPHDAAGYGH